MPIYCNVIRIAQNSEAQLRHEVAKWITGKMGGTYRITPDRLFSPEASGRSGRNEVKIVAAGEREPTTISISFPWVCPRGIAGPLPASDGLVLLACVRVECGAVRAQSAEA